MGFLESLGLELAKDIGKRLIDAIVPLGKDRPVETVPPDFESRISEHLASVARITERVEFFGLAEAKHTDRDTIDLFVSLPRKFAGARSQRQISESALLRRQGHYILLG